MKNIEEKTEICNEYLDCQTKVVIFSHFGSLNRIPKVQDIENDRHLNYYSALLENYINCNKNKKLISIVYIYVDWAVKRVLPNMRVENGRFPIDSQYLQEEIGLKGALGIAEQHAILRSNCPNSHLPKFFYIGLMEIITLLNNLIEADPDMPLFLRGNQGEFTYDSPKFIESIIRLSRGDCGHLANFPIIRVDEDALPNEKCLESLINAYKNVSVAKPFYFFSGSYGRKDKKYDPINDFAVRTHWFFPEGTLAGSDYSRNNIDKVETFLADLEMLGAKQPVVHEYSINLKELIRRGNIPQLVNGSRLSSQVISGSGLIMSRRNINLLPPFMNLNKMTSWIDDHLKRKLHEALNDMTSFDLEVVTNSETFFHQEREPNPLTKDFINSFSEEYFERLLSGCLFSSLISDQNGIPTKYTERIKDLVWYRKKNEINDDKSLKIELSKIIKKRFDNVLYCWSSPEYEGNILYFWAIGKNNSEYKNKLCSPNGEILNDAFEYLTLLENWHIFTRAIERLSFFSNSWLFYNEV